MLAQTQLVPSLPLDDWTNSVVGWITETLEPITEPLDTLIEGAVGGLAFVLTYPPELVMIVLLAAYKNAPTGWVLRSAHQATVLATRFLEMHS